MAYKRKTTLRNHTVSLDVVSDERSGEYRYCVNNMTSESRKSKPFLTETEIFALGDLIQDFRETEIRAFKKNVREKRTQPSKTILLAKNEIREAICTAQKSTIKKRTHRPAMVYVSPMPKYRYRYTCPECGSHVRSTLRLGHTSLRLCSACGKVHSTT